MTDLPADASTPARIRAGDSLRDTLGFAGDRDWFAIDARAGDYVDISLTGGALPDPLLRVYDASGRVIGLNDDADGLDSRLDLFFAETGRYYIEAASYGDTGTGSYTLRVDALDYAPLGDPLDALRWGGSVRQPTVIDVYYAKAGERFDGITSEGFTAYEKAQIAKVFSSLAKLMPVNFRPVDKASDADFKLVLDTDELPYGVLGHFNPPGTTGAGIGVFSGAAWDRAPGGDLEPGGLGYQTIVHEILHGLGLSHPHDGGGSSRVMDGVDQPFGDYGFFNLNQGVYTAMSYNRGLNTGDDQAPPDRDSGREAGAMALDIAVLQGLYGTRAHATGHDVYTLPDGGGGGTFWTAIWDTGGRDEIRAGADAGDTVIDLRAATLRAELGGGGFVSGSSGVAGGFTIAHGVVIENAEGGAGRDTIIGNAAGNRLVGGGGDDALFGGAGRDILMGREGADLMEGGTGDDTLRGNGGDDRILGGAGADVVSGETGDDRLMGEAGDDIIDGGPGRDRSWGGAGTDVFVFERPGDSNPGPATRDIIYDFTRGEDLIDLGSVFAGTLSFTAQPDWRVGEVHLREIGADTRVRVNLDTDTRLEMEIFVRGVTGLDESDFLL